MIKPLKVRLIILIVLLLGAIFSFYAAFREDRRGILTVAFLDVGQGDAIYIEAPNGNQILIDGGPGKAVLRELSKVMPFYDRSIDIVIATHADQDHVGGLPDVLNKYKVNIFMEPGVPGESSSYKELEKIVEELQGFPLGSLKGEPLKTKKILARRDMEVDLGNGAILQILFPDRDPTGMETNMASVVARLVYGENEFLLTGDSPKAIEDYLVSLSQGQPLKIAPEGLPLNLTSDILKAGHHGSKTSTSAELVSAVSPQYAIISVGKDNKYGHPNQEVMNILNNFGAKILRTDEEGRIVFKSDGVNLKVK
ncbi:MAG: MBL fold metallo-hydrolase [Patescibacteria group bacterium]